jgi:hypothetical protein
LNFPYPFQSILLTRYSLFGKELALAKIQKGKRRKKAILHQQSGWPINQEDMLFYIIYLPSS